MESFAGIAWSGKLPGDRLGVRPARWDSCWESRNGVGGASLRACDLDLHGIVTHELTIGAPFFLVGGSLLEHQDDLMSMKQLIEVHETELLLL